MRPWAPTVRAVCPACAEVEIPAPEVWLRVCGNVPSLSTFGFRCPACHQQIVKSASSHQTCLLLSVGIRAVVWTVPAEALELHDGPALDRDDLLDFALSLGSCDMWAELA